MSPMSTPPAPIDSRKAGRKGAIISLETSVRNETVPSAMTVAGSFAPPGGGGSAGVAAALGAKDLAVIVHPAAARVERTPGQVEGGLDRGDPREVVLVPLAQAQA